MDNQDRDRRRWPENFQRSAGPVARVWPEGPSRPVLETSSTCLEYLMDAASYGMDGDARSPLDVAEATFRLLACDPGGLALDCRRLGSDLPQLSVYLVELR